MKKIYSIIILSFFIFNCSSPIEFTFAGGFKDGTYYKIGESLNIIKEFKVNEISTDGSLDNLYNLADKKADFSISQLDVIQNLAIGDRESLNKIKVLFPLYGEEVHIIALKGIESVPLLKGKRISIGDSESGSKYTSLIFLDQMGINSDTSVLEEIDSTTSLKLLLEGKLDAMILVAGAPVKILSDLSEESSNKIHLLSIPDENLQVVRGTSLTYQRAEIPASTYPWEIKPINTIIVQSVIISRSDLEEKIVSSFVKSVWKNKDSLATRHEKWKSINKEALEKHLSKNPDIFHPIMKGLVNSL